MREFRFSGGDGRAIPPPMPPPRSPAPAPYMLSSGAAGAVIPSVYIIVGVDDKVIVGVDSAVKIEIAVFVAGEMVGALVNLKVIVAVDLAY